MQETPTVIRKWSELQGLAAVSINTGKKAGIIDDFYFDIQTNEVRALLIKTGIFGHMVLLSSSISAIGQDALTFANEDLLVKEGDNQNLPKLPQGRGLLSYRILSEGGNIIGTIGNILLDITTVAELKITEFEMAVGLLSHLSKNYPTFKASEIIRYGQDVIIIPDNLGLSLQKH